MDITKMEYYISKKFIVVEDNKLYNIYPVKEGKKYKINQSVFELLKRINKNSRCKLNDNEKKCINDLINKGILTTNIGENGQNSIKSVVNINRIFIELTRKCNLKCEHCYNESSINTSEPNMLNLNEIRNIIDQACELGIWQFDVTGGEVFLRDDLFDILEYAKEKGMITSVFSNLTIINENQINKFKNLNIKKFITSIDAYQNKTHDLFRGVKGSLSKTIKNIRLLKNNGFDVTVNIVLGPHNEHEIPDLINYLNMELKVPYVVDVLLPSGRAENINNDLKKYSQMLPYLTSICGKNIICTEYDLQQKTIRKSNKSCGVGEKMIYITSEGMVNLCPSLTYRVNPSFGIGNIRDEKLSTINKKLFSRYPNLKGKECLDCEKLDECKAGCRSRAYHIYGDLKSADKMNCYLFGVKNEI